MGEAKKSIVQKNLTKASFGHSEANLRCASVVWLLLIWMGRRVQPPRVTVQAMMLVTSPTVSMSSLVPFQLAETQLLE